MSVKVYNLSLIDTLKLQCNFTEVHKLAFFTTESAISLSKIPFAREHFHSYGNKPIYMLRVEGKNIDPEYGTDLPHKGFNTNLVDYFHYVHFPEDFDSSTMDVVLCMDRGVSPSQCVLSNVSLSGKIYVQKDKYGVGNASTSGCMYILDKETREIIAYSESAYSAKWEEKYVVPDIFGSLVSGEPGYRTNEEMKATFILQGIDKIFATKDDALYYIETGEELNRLDDDSDEGLAEDREVTLYYESDIFSRAYNSSTSSHIGASTIHFRVQYKNNKGDVIVNPYRAICGYVANNNVPNDSNRFGNITWVANNNINLLETKQHPVNGTIAPSKSIPNYNNTTGFYPPYIDNNTIYDARYRTNMRIFANEQDAIDFLGGGNPTPIGESGNQFNPNGFIGDKTVFNDGHDLKGGGMSSCWIMNESQLEDLANVFTTGLTKVEEQDGDLIINITKTCARAFASHGEPIDAVVDLFWLPFDPSEFVIAGSSSFTLSQDDLSTATSLLKITAQSGDVVKAHGTRSFGESKEFVENVVDTMGGMFGTTIQKVQNVGN